MDNIPDAQAQPRRPRLVLPGAVDSPPRPKIVLPGHGLIDPSAPALDEAPVAMAVIKEAESIGSETEAPIQEEAVLEPDALLIDEPAEIPAPSDDFLAEPSSEDQADYPSPDVQAQPAELKVIAPRRLGPPVGWVPPEFANEPDLPGQNLAQALPSDPYQVPAWQPEMTEFTPEPEATEAEAFVGYAPNTQAESEIDTAWPELHPTSEPEEYLPAESVPLEQAPSPLVPRSLTSPHQVRPGTHQVTHRSSGRYNALPAHSAQTQSATQPNLGQPQQQSNPLPQKPVIRASERLLPAWVLVIIGLLLGTIGAVFTIARTSMAEKIGLISRTESNSYAMELIKEERSQVQSMLNSYHERTKINLAEEMAEFRSEVGRKPPEKMTLTEFRQSAKAVAPKPAEDAKPNESIKTDDKDKAGEEGVKDAADKNTDTPKPGTPDK